MSKNTEFTVTNQVRSKAGKKAASNMSPEQRRERAIKAALGRKSVRDLPKATHEGELIIGDKSIVCAVLEDGRRVINETSMFSVLDRSRTGRKPKKGNGGELPAFLSANNLKSLVINSGINGTHMIVFAGKTGKKCYGYEATIIPEICKIYLEAEELEILQQSQMPTVKRCKIILHSLASVGITALIDAATGFEKVREKNELQKLFEKFIEKELRPWTQRFPYEFFENLKRMYGLEHLKGNPSFFGHLINNYIYEEISPEILKELKRKNPYNDSGNRKHRHHQFLTEDIGCDALKKQIVKVNTLLSVTDNIEEFKILYDKTKRKT